MACYASLLYTAQPLAIFISLSTLVATGTPLSPYNTFIILSIISTIRIAVCSSTALALISLADFSVALERIQAFLELNEPKAHEKLFMAFSETKQSKEIGDNFHLINGGSIYCRSSNLDSPTNTSQGPNETKERLSSHYEDKSIFLHDVHCKWNGCHGDPVLKSASLSVNDGDLVLITGHVGCGKSSLLYTILRELPTFKGRVLSNGKIAYVGQKPWVFSGTVQENILFGQTFNLARYNMTLESCDLDQDLQRFPDGDKTGIGEHGIMLSGGQRARVALARAVYANADIYLLDDPLSAVDSKVSKHIFDKCILGALHDKTRLLATHTLQLLPEADHIILMKEGLVIAKGSYKKLIQEGNKLQSHEIGSLKDTNAINDRKCQEIYSHKTAKKSVGLESQEDRLTGTVSWKLYWKYLKAGLSFKSFVALSSFFVLTQGRQFARKEEK